MIVDRRRQPVTIGSSLSYCLQTSFFAASITMVKAANKIVIAKSVAAKRFGKPKLIGNRSKDSEANAEHSLIVQVVDALVAGSLERQVCEGPKLPTHSMQQYTMHQGRHVLHRRWTAR